MKRYLLLSLSILSVFALSAQSATEAKKIVADKIAAVVGDRIIMYSDIKNTIADYARQGAEIPENAECHDPGPGYSFKGLDAAGRKGFIARNR